jgi:hypothetical protein
MAMNPWMTALQAALGGASGALQGYGQQKERKLAEDEAEAQKKRLVMADTLALLNAGGMERGTRVATANAGLNAASSMAQNAMSGMRGNLPSAPFDAQAMQNAMGMTGPSPAASFDVGGKTYDIMQTPLQRSMMLAEQEAQRTKQAEADKRSTLKAEQQAKQAEGASVVAKALAKGASEADKAAAVAGGFLTPGQVGYQTEAEKERYRLDAARDAREERKVNAEIAKMALTGDGQRPLSTENKVRLSLAKKDALNSSEKMQAIEDEWLKEGVEIKPFDVAAAKDVMIPKSTTGVAAASAWQSGLNPFGLDEKNQRRLTNYLAYAKQHATAIRLIAARGGSNQLQAADEALVSGAFGGGGKESIGRARDARTTINEGLLEGIEAATSSTNRTPSPASNTTIPGFVTKPTGPMSAFQQAKQKVQGGGK